MSFRATAILLALVVILGGAVYFVEQSSPAATPADASTDTVMSFLSSDATELEASTKDQSVVVAKDSTGAWQLQKPEVAPADQPRVESVVAELASLPAMRTLESPGDLAQFGLADPSLTVKVSLKSGAAKTLLLGSESPDKSGYYAKLPDTAAVYLIDASSGLDLTQLVETPPKATPTPTPPPAETPGTETPIVGTPTTIPAGDASSTVTPPADEAVPVPAASGTPEPDALPPQSATGTPEIPDVPVPTEALTPTPAP